MEGKKIGGYKDITFCGIGVTDAEMELIRETIRDFGNLSRTELANTLCEFLDWRRPNGGLKAHECRLFLEKLEEWDVLRLPVSKGKPKRSAAIAPASEEDDAPLLGKLGDLGPLALEAVDDPAKQLVWRGYVARHHYLGCKVPFGAHLRYFLRTSLPAPRLVGCLQVSSPAWKMAPRDQWIGWTDAERQRGLQRIVQNSRFLIFPWVKVSYLASAALSLLARRVGNDWEARYAIRPLLMETLVDSSRFRGTCYRAANWIHLGQTTGRGRMDRKHEREGAAPKEVFVYPLTRKFREKLRLE